MFVIDEIKYILANMMDIILNQKGLHQLKVELLLLQLVILLLEYCEVSSESEINDLQSNERIIEIIIDMNEQFANASLGLQNIAVQFSLNPQYLSIYIKEKTG